MNPRPWSPILDGALADRAMHAIETIAGDRRMRTVDDAEGASSLTLAGGAAGRALFYAYRAAARDGEDAALAVDLLDAAVTGLERVTLSPSLHEGFAGIAWVHAHFAGWLFDADAEDTGAVDEALEGYLSGVPWTDDFDLISGLVGFGVYALEIRPRPAGDRLLRHVLARLVETAVRSEQGMAWFTTPIQLGPIGAAKAPEGCFNLGMAHGAPGVIALLGWMSSVGLPVEAELTSAVSWLLQQQLPSDRDSAFPVWTGPALTPVPARLAWCYGDPGIVMSLLAAARGGQRPDWEHDALRLARRAASRSAESSGVRDAGLCHGAAGVAHVFNRAYQATGELWLADAARWWFTRTLDLAVHEHGIGRFAAYNVSDADTETWDVDSGFLTGAAGIGLALLGACTPIEPAWDRVILTSVP